MSDDPRKAIVGAWRLVHVVEHRPTGERFFPFGEYAIGSIVYSESGVVAVQIARRARKADVQDRLACGPSDYLAYFGRFELDTTRKSSWSATSLRDSFGPECHPGTLERNYRFYDDKLSLRPSDDADREILWQRA